MVKSKNFTFPLNYEVPIIFFTLYPLPFSL